MNALCRLLLLLSTLWLVSCATTAPSRIEQVTVPETIGDQGLLVGSLAGRAVAANLVERQSFPRASLRVDGVLYRGAVHDGYIVLPLAAG
jgi:hypothetical protein